MRRTIEICSALGATTIGIIGVATEVRAIQYPFDDPRLAGLAPTNNWAAMSGAVNHFMVLLALSLMGVSIGAYLHSMHDSVWGRAILWGSTVSLLAATAYAILMPPSFNYPGGSVSAVVLDVVPTALSVITVVLAAVAAMAAITPSTQESLPTASGRFGRVDRIGRPHSSRL